MIARAKVVADIHRFIAAEIERGSILCQDEVAALFLAAACHDKAYASFTASDLEPFAQQALAAYSVPSAEEARQHAAELRAFVELRRRKQ